MFLSAFIKTFEFRGIVDKEFCISLARGLHENFSSCVLVTCSFGFSVIDMLSIVSFKTQVQL